MRCKSALLFLFASCTPMERGIVEEVIHEASVAEQSIEKDIEGQQQGIPNVTQEDSPQVRRSDEKGRDGLQKEGRYRKKEKRYGEGGTLCHRKKGGA